MDNQVQQVVVRCKDCGQKNRVLESAVHGTYGCGKCGAVLPVPFRYLVLDSETTGLPSRRHVPHLVQLAWSVHASDGTLLAERNYIVRPDGYSVPQASTRIHGITDEQARRDGVPLRHVLDAFLVEADSEGVRLVAHNMAFDSAIMKGELERIGRESTLDERPGYCTMRSTVDLCRIPRRGGGYKWPSLQELHLYLHGQGFDGAHDAMKDVQATARCFFELRQRGLVEYH